MKFRFARDVSRDEWRALPRDFKAGETIYRFDGHDYGCARDDMMYGKQETISCCEIVSMNPFFTVPVHMLLDERGNTPRGDYMSLTRRAAETEAPGDPTP